MTPHDQGAEKGQLEDLASLSNSNMLQGCQESCLGKTR